ncbi:hypothetical protein HK107_13605 [Parvularcula sp. ZS-1/3]|uniref:Tail specific protease domain-containing protein n=1 Tax=Parvularcula mediterranea TaxID=2732508 RepID=A0A7Y3W6I0_9PROT|nr:S41 family peptidase [Parvularcula mediterranea]NNU17362.1 hypothetical protein [Parvularcula mediterranea]
MRPFLSVLVFSALSACAAQKVEEHPFLKTPQIPAEALAEGERPLSPEELREDFAALYAGLKSGHFDLFVNRSEEAYDALFADMEAGLDQPLHPSEALFIFQRFAAFGDIAHARVEGVYDVWGRYRAAGGRALPVFPAIRDGRIFVSESYAPRVMQGEEIVAINGAASSDWLERLSQTVSCDNPYICGTLLERTFSVEFWAEAGAPDEVVLTLRGLDGRLRDENVRLLTSEELAAAELTSAGEVFTLGFGDRDAKMLEGGAAYLRPGPFFSYETPENPWQTEGFKAFIDESFETFQREGAAALILDIRQNPGGTNSFSDPIIQWFADEPFRFYSSFEVRSSPEAEASNEARLALAGESDNEVSRRYAESFAETPYGETFTFDLPFVRPLRGKRFEGEVYVLVDRYSYSNAVTVAAIIQDYGFGLIVGEETSDLASTYGAMETFTLPNSGLVVGFPKARIVRPSGDPAPVGVIPDIAIEIPPFATEDVALEKLLGIIAGRE